MGSHSFPVESDPAYPDWQQIEDLLDELAEVSKSTLSASQFYRLLVDRMVPAVGACAGAVWTAGRAGELRLECQMDLGGASGAPIGEVFVEHQAQVEQVLSSGQPRVVGSNRESNSLILHPFRAGPGIPGVIELVRRGPLPPAERDAYLRLLGAVVELTDDFHRNLELGALREREQRRAAQERFIQRVHHSLDLDQTAFLMANEGRAALGCDRLTVLVRRGGKCRAVATSGVDQLDRRAQLVRLLEQLATRCTAAEEPLWYCDGAADMPHQIERPLRAFLDESHARVVSIVPLREPLPGSNDRPARIIGVLVAERFDAAGGDGELRERMAAVADPCGTALNNALVHAHLPLSSLGHLLARLRPLAERRQLPKWALAIGVVAAAIAALALIPADFDIEARGELEPKRRREVFASADGVVSELLASHARPVKAGEPLVKLRKPELDLELGRVAGEIQTAEKKLAAVQAERLENAPDRTDEKRNIHQLTADEEELKELLKGLETEREILKREQADLVVRSPIDGQALTWNLEQLLAARPVERGQALLTVADLDGPWVALLRLADHRTGHVLAARDELRPDLDVSFALASEPGAEYHGRISDVALTTDLDQSESPTVLVTVAFDRREVAGLRPGATVLAKIHCGRRAIGYVWLHELFEFVQSHWWW